MAVTLHPTALVDPAAQLGDGTTVGPYAIVEAGAVIGRDNQIGPQAYIFGCVRMGDRNRLLRNASLGGEPQDLGYKGEPTVLTVGDGNTFGENIVVHRGSQHGGETVVGDENFLMSNVHIGHDCRVGNKVVLSSGAILGGHATVHDGAIFGGNAGAHQWVRVGMGVMVGGLGRVRQDLLPFTISNEAGRLYGMNWVGLRRGGLPFKSKSLVKEAYRRFCIRREGLADFRAWLDGQEPDALIDAWKAFLAEKSKRGYARSVRGPGGSGGDE